MNNILKNSLYIFGLVFALALLVLGVTEIRSLLTGATKDIEPQSVSTSNITSNSATVNFTTDKETATLISYGTDANSLTLFAAEPNQAQNHAITLSFLSPNTIYFYTIKIGENAFSNNNSPYQFTTKPADQDSKPNFGDTFDKIKCNSFSAAVENQNLEFDLNKDGRVNTLDYTLSKCLTN